MKNITAAMLFLPLVLITACSSDYPAKAVEKARETALKECRELSEYQRHFIRYREPVIMQNVIFANNKAEFRDFAHVRSRFDQDRLVKPEYDFMHTAIVWEVPELGGCVVVDGTSLRNMMFWDSDRVLYKQFIKINPYAEPARLKALHLAMNGLPGMTPDERLQVRFAMPDVRETDFDVEPAGKLDDARKKGGWMEYLKAAAEEDEPCQISMIWRIPGKNYAIVVCGFSDAQTLADWKPETVLVVSQKDLQKNIRSKENLLK